MVNTFERSKELKPLRDFVVEHVKADPKLTRGLLRKLLADKFGPERSALSAKTIGNWMHLGKTGSYYRVRGKQPSIQVKHKEKQTATPPATIVTAPMPTSSDIATALLGRVVHAINNSDLLVIQLREAKSMIARLEEKVNKVEGERDRVLKIHNECIAES
ncbi:hypothetical protein MUP59_06850, partial [Candidatus Bathyarchaeota archaeon]|nr:hypothetical protein [Candidatus Bathyarchaeota archaeon]